MASATYVLQFDSRLKKFSKNFLHFLNFVRSETSKHLISDLIRLRPNIDE